MVADKGVPLAKTPEGLKPISSSRETLPSGNIEVKASDGKMKVLPHTGGKFTLLFSILGSFSALISGLFFSKKDKKKT